MKAILEVSPDRLESILNHGLQTDAQAPPEEELFVSRTNQLLASHCPHELKDEGITPGRLLYASLQDGKNVINIADGSMVPLSTFVEQSDQSVIELELDASRCFVADLDTYDAIKFAVENHKNPAAIEKLAVSYWRKVIRLSEYTPDLYRRPEIIIPYDVEAARIRRLK